MFQHWDVLFLILGSAAPVKINAHTKDTQTNMLRTCQKSYLLTFENTCYSPKWGNGEGILGVLYIICICGSQRRLCGEILWSSWTLVQQNISLQHSWCCCLSWFASLIAMCSIQLWFLSELKPPLPRQWMAFFSCSSYGCLLCLPILPSPTCFWSSSYLP